MYPLLIDPEIEETVGNEFGWEAFAELTPTPVHNKTETVAIRNSVLKDFTDGR